MQKKNKEVATNIDFVWKRLCGYDTQTYQAKKCWNVRGLVKVNMKKAGLYVMLGKSKRNSVYLLKNKSEDEKLDLLSKIATMDHVIS